MANERFHGMRIFRSVLMRSVSSPAYWIKVLTAAVMAFVSPYILLMVADAAKLLPVEMVEIFRQGSGYNIGVLTVPSLDIIYGDCCDRLITGVLSGSISQMLVVFVCTGLVRKEFAGGYVNLAIMRGQSRSVLFAKYIGANVICALLPAVVYPLGVAASVVLGNGMAVENIGMVISTVLVQLVMMLALTVCIASVAVMLDGVGAAVLGLCSVFALPFLPYYISVFTGGKVDIGRWMLLSRLVDSGEMLAADIPADILTALVTAAVFYCFGWMIFTSRNFK